MRFSTILAATGVFLRGFITSCEDAPLNVQSSPPPIEIAVGQYVEVPVPAVEQYIEVPLPVSKQDAPIGQRTIIDAQPCASSSEKCSKAGNQDAQGEAADEEARRLTALPNVANVYFQDTDLGSGLIGGTVSWTYTSPYPPLGVTGYEVFLTDSVGSTNGRVALGSLGAVCAPFSTCSHSITFSTETLGSHTHIFVHTRTNLGVSPLGTGIAVCDVDQTDSIHLVNTYPTPAPWGIIEISFYRTADCTGSSILFATSSTSGDKDFFPSGHALDGSTTTAWVSNCTAPCGMGTQSFGILGICQPQELRCFKMKQCYLDNSNTCHPAGGGRATGLAVMVRGVLVQTWSALVPQVSQNTIIEETLVLASRRRRGYYGVFSDLDTDIARTTNPAFSR